MHKTLLLSALIILSSAARTQGVVDPTLQGLHKFSSEYFRSDPFKTDFSVFLKHLINDPTIENKTVQMRTDTSLYAFYGRYKDYNPFFFKPKRVEILLRETELAVSDTGRAADTIFTYELIAYANDDAKGLEDVHKEFEKIHRQTKRKFFDTTSDESKEGEEVITAWHNYFVPYYAIAPASVLWGRLRNQNEIALNITLRFKMSSNKAILPMPLYSSK